jgi:hypothetical protein
MKNIFFYLMSAGFLIGSLSCSNSNKSPSYLDVTTITLTDNVVEIGAQELKENTELIPLSSIKSEALINEISKVVLAGDSIIVLDARANKVLLFDKTGAFIHSFRKIGRGPGEYIAIADLILDKDLYILDIGGRKIHNYSLSGEWNKSINVNPVLAGYQFEKNGNSFLFYRSNESGFDKGSGMNLVTVNFETNTLIDSASIIDPTIKDKSIVGAHSGLFSKFDGNTYALIPFDSLIYTIDKSGSISAAYKIDIPLSFRAHSQTFWNMPTSGDSDFNHRLQNSEAMHNFGNLLINSNYVCFSFLHRGIPKFCVYSKKTKTSKIYNTFSIKPVDNGGLDLVALEGNSLYFVLRTPDIDSLNSYFDTEIKAEDNSLLIKFNITH